MSNGCGGSLGIHYRALYDIGNICGAKPIDLTAGAVILCVLLSRFWTDFSSA
jgi:hypothetical protein